MDRCVDAAMADADVGRVHLQGYSTSVPAAAAYAALEPEKVRTLVLQGPPLDFSAGEAIGLFRLLATNTDVERLVETFDTLPAPLMDAVFSLRKPVEYGVTSPLRLWDRLDDDEFVEAQGRKLAWVRDGPDVPAATVRDFVEDLLIENRLIRNELRLDGERVDLGRIEAPVLLVLGAEDAFVPRAASVPFLDAISSTDAEVIEFPTGHVGLSVAPEAHETGWPRVLDWLDARS